MIFRHQTRKGFLAELLANNILSTNDQIKAVQRPAHKLHQEVPLQVISNRLTTTAYMYPTLAVLREQEMVVVIIIRHAVSPTTSSANNKSKAWIRKRSYAATSQRSTAPWSSNRLTRAYRAQTMPRLSKESSSNQKRASNRVSRKDPSQYNNSHNSVVSKAFQLHSKTVKFNGFNNSNCHLKS